MNSRKKEASFRPEVIIWIAAIILVVILVCVPIGYMLVQSITDKNGAFTLANFVKYLGKKRIIDAIINTLLVGVSISVLSALLGVFMAFGVSRTNMKGKGLVRSSVIISIITPPFLLSLAYIILAGPNMGLFNRFLRQVFHLATDYGPINIYSIIALVVLSLPMGIATIFLIVFPALGNIDPYFEEASRISGASFGRTAFSVTLPLVKPAIISGMVLAFGQSVALYGVPQMLNINVLTIAIRESVVTLNLKEGAVLSVVITVLSLCAILLYRRSVRSSNHYQTISAKGFRPGVTKLGKTRHVFTLVGIVYSMIAFVIPYATLIMTSFMKSIGNGFVRSNLTFGNYIALFGNSSVIKAFKNSFILAVGTATVVVLLGLIISYLIVRAKVKGKGVLEYLSNLPMGISGTALAMGLIFMYLAKPLSALHLYGTLGIMMIAYCTRQLPSGMRYAQTALIQINYELEEAARISGATWLRTTWDVTIPLAKSSLFYSWILAFITAFPELSSSVMLRNNRTDVISTAIMNIWNGGQGGIPTAAAFATVVFLLITLLIAIAQKVTGKSLLEKSEQ